MINKVVIPEPHTLLLESEKCHVCGDTEAPIRPNHGRTVTCISRLLFRAERAESVDGIDYSAFLVESAFVGQRSQYRDVRLATDVLIELRRKQDMDDGYEGIPGKFDTCQAGLYISMTVRNISDRPQRFAIKLVGRAVY